MIFNDTKTYIKNVKNIYCFSGQISSILKLKIIIIKMSLEMY